MDSSQPAMLRLISSAVSLASRAGAEVRRITKSGQLGVVDKGYQDFQTEADRVAQRMIVASLTKLYPKCAIVGEEDLEEDKKADELLFVDSHDESVLKIDLPEQYRNVREEDITVWVDPLDGTAEFVKGLLEHVTVLIGISIEGRSVAGVINQPFHPDGDRTMWGLVGLGCFGVEKRPVPSDRLIVTTTASHGNVNIDEAIEAIKPDEVLKKGGAGYKVLLVIEGKAHSYVFASSGSKRWDTSAPEAVLESIGGKLTDVFGNRIDYSCNTERNYLNRTGIVASVDDDLHSKILRRIPSNVKERLLSPGKL